jgi:branched-chain amino acid transport system permease protein
MDVIIIGLLLGGTYALMAMGLQLQYGVARIMNLASGETLVCGAFGAVWFFTAYKLSPLYALIGVVPLAFVANWAIYRVMILPLVRRAKSQGQLEVDSILATFGLSFVAIGILLAMFGGEFLAYSYLATPFVILGQPYALNRIVAFLCAAVLAPGFTSGCTIPARASPCGPSRSTLYRPGSSVSTWYARRHLPSRSAARSALPAARCSACS